MTDPVDEVTPMNPSTESSKIRDEPPSLQPNDILREFRNTEVSKELETFRILINMKYRLTYDDDDDVEKRAARWKPVIVQLLRSLVSSEEVGEERVLLGSLAFVTVLFANCKFEDFKDHLSAYWSLEEPVLSAFGDHFLIRDLEWFKLVIAHGYLKVNIETMYTSEIIFLPFEVIRRNCLGYTNYSYFAYKTLQFWLDKSAKTNFWHENAARRTEKELEAVIFSNWDSCICEIARRNATEIFPAYLKIMSEKYDGFPNLIFDKCVQNLSWQNVNKYAILTEVCKILEDTSVVVSSDLPVCTFTSLTKNHLKHAGTKLYLTIMTMLKGNEWENIFGESFLRVSQKWEQGQQWTAIEFLWEQWMKPTMRKFPRVFQFLWESALMKQLEVSKSYLERIGDRLGFELIYNGTNIRDVLNRRVVDFSEHVRLNAFAIVCQNKNWKYPATENEPFAVVKRFLYFNVDSSSVTLRKGIIKNFEILIGNKHKFDGERQAGDDGIEHSLFYNWLHEFLLDCLDIGSSYQRKILALSLYKVILKFAHVEAIVTPSVLSKEIAGYRPPPPINYDEFVMMSMKATTSNCWKWKFVNGRSLITFLKLVLDQMTDVREKSADILTQYLFIRQLTPVEHKFLSDLAIRYCNSSKFYEAASGSTMRRVQWLLSTPSRCGVSVNPYNYVQHRLATFDALTEALIQLEKMQFSRDILNCAVNGSPFFGSMMTILECFSIKLNRSEDPHCRDVRNEVYEEYKISEMLRLAEKATDFFLSALSSKSAQFEYSSSFAEMGLAIEESIKNSEVNEDADEYVLSSSHQLVVSCIWMSLKVCCELAAAIGVFAAEMDLEPSSVLRKDMITHATDLIVSVLLKCRHKGAIEAAGLALAKLTRAISTTCYVNVIEKHLSDLLNVEDKGNINLTRRGAGLSIMFHRIVSSDERKNRPMLHASVKQLLDSLKTQTEERLNQRKEDCIRESSKARHLHFLRFTVADKSLQTQLVPYMEDICLTCLKYLQSPEWTVRNASLQLFGAIVPRLVGQCSARELDYGIGNSVDHFVTHYPILANSVLMQLESLASPMDVKKNLCYENLQIVSNIVSILTLFSKMSTGGCELVDYSSENYISRAKRTFVFLFGHPIFHVRVLASKAYAAFVALPKIPRVLATMKFEFVDDRSNNYQHGQLCSQIYLGRKLKHEMQCSSETIIVRRHKIHEAELKLGLVAQLQKVNFLRAHHFHNDNQHFCYIVKSTLITCLLESRSLLCFFDLKPELDSTLVEKCVDASKQPGVAEFVKNLETLEDQLQGNQYDASSDALEPEARQYMHDSTEEKDDSSLLSRIREISERLNNDDVDAKGPVIESIQRLIEDSTSSNDRPFIFDPRCEYTKLWIEVIIAMLTDDDSEVRESMAQTLHPVMRVIVGGSERPLCARAICHKILNKLSLVWIEDPSTTMIDGVLEIFRRLANAIKLNEATEGLKSPFNQDESFHRDYASLLNILFYCVRTLIERISPTGTSSVDGIEAQQINGIIHANRIERGVAKIDSSDLKIILQLSTSDYLSHKKRSLIRTIDKHRSVRGHELIGDSNSP